jgi:uncharacterized protein (TIGR02147 family)
VEQITVFNYSNPRQFLMERLNARQKNDPDFSIRAWAKELQIGSHTLLIMLLNGKRPLRLKHVPAFAQNLKLPSAERLYFQALIQFDSATTQEEKELYSVWLSELSPGKDFKTKEMDQFLVISHWVYTAIIMMTELKSFSGTGQEISRLLKGRVTPIEAQSALQRLLDLGLIAKSEDGKFRATYDRVTTRDDIANEGAKKYHQTAIEAASQAIQEVPLDQREFQSFTMAVRKDKLPLAKEMIRRFRSQFSSAVGAEGDGDDVYQLNLHFFQLTESPSRMVRVEDEGVELGHGRIRPEKEPVCLTQS